MLSPIGTRSFDHSAEILPISGVHEDAGYRHSPAPAIVLHPCRHHPAGVMPHPKLAAGPSVMGRAFGTADRHWEGRWSSGKAHSQQSAAFPTYVGLTKSRKFLTPVTTTTLPSGMSVSSGSVQASHQPRPSFTLPCQPAGMARVTTARWPMKRALPSRANGATSGIRRARSSVSTKTPIAATATPTTTTTVAGRSAKPAARPSPAVPH